jgi:hypothetical protein
VASFSIILNKFNENILELIKEDNDIKQRPSHIYKTMFRKILKDFLEYRRIIDEKRA